MLDVYKRQIHFSVGDVSAKISQMIKSLSAFGVGRSLIFREKRCNLTADKGSVDPVSYTHLDVYKRQLQMEQPCSALTIKPGFPRS